MLQLMHCCNSKYGNTTFVPPLLTMQMAASQIGCMGSKTWSWAFLVNWNESKICMKKCLFKSICRWLNVTTLWPHIVKTPLPLYWASWWNQHTLILILIPKLYPHLTSNLSWREFEAFWLIYTLAVLLKLTRHSAQGGATCSFYYLVLLCSYNVPSRQRHTSPVYYDFGHVPC